MSGFGGIIGGLGGAIIGFAVGGPVGAQMGYLAGSMLGNLLDPPKYETPEPAMQKVQLSEYDRPIPILYGTDRFAGTVIWQKYPFDKHKEKTGGKGTSPEVTSTTFSTSFVVLLCANEIDDVIQVFADGRLVWPNDEDESFTFTLYRGTEDQEPDPTMEAELGVGQVPGHRGYAYVVFTDLMLKDFGERIPQLEFVVSTMPPTDDLRIVQSEYDTGTGPWVDYPILVDWPYGGEAVVGAASIGPVTNDIISAQTFDAESFQNNGTTDTVTSGLEFPNGESTAGIGGWRGLGIHETASDSLSLYWSQLHSGTVASSPVVSIPAGFTQDILGDAGVPGGLYVTSAALTQDGEALFVFTSATSRTDDATHWYKIVDLEVVEDGTVSPSVALSCYGRQCAVSQTNGQGSFENNARYFWYMETDGTTARVFYIDDAGNFAEVADSPISILFPDPITANERSTVAALAREGYAGVFKGQSLVLLSRLGPRAEVPIADIVDDISARTGRLEVEEYDTSDIPDTIHGYRITAPMEARNAIQPLRQYADFNAAEIEGVITYVKSGHDSVVTVPDDDLAARPDGDAPPAIVRTVRKQEVDCPRAVYVAHINPDFDYQDGNEHDKRQVTRSQTETTVTLPMAIPPASAKAVAGNLLWAAFREREAYTFWLSRKYWKYDPTDVMNVGGVDVAVERITEQANGVLEFEGTIARPGLFDPAGSASSPGGGSTQPPQEPPVAKQVTDLILLNLPLIREDDSISGFDAAMGPALDGPWPGASLFRSVDGGSTYESIAATSDEAVVGTVATATANFAGGNVIDYATVIRVETNGGELSSVTELALLNGSNLAAVGNEVIQYQTATLVAANTYDLTGLLRGRRGTEWAIGTHGADERFVALPVLNVSAPPAQINKLLQYKGVTYGKTVASAVAQTFANNGAKARPFAPVHIRGGCNSAGDLAIEWVRRTRLIVASLDGIATPLGEESEAYVVQVWDATYTDCARIIEVTSPAATYTAAQQITDFGDEQQTIYITVGQKGRYALGTQARAALPGAGPTVDAVLAPITPYNGSAVPPSGGGAVNVTLSYPSDIEVTTGYKIGDTYVAKFTTGGSAPTAGYIATSEYGDPAYMRHVVLSTDVDGTTVIAQQYGNTATLLWNEITLATATDYFFIIKSEVAPGVPSGPLGASAVMRVNLLAS